MKLSQSIVGDTIEIGVDLTTEEAERLGIKCGGPGSGVPGPCPTNSPAIGGKPKDPASLVTEEEIRQKLGTSNGRTLPYEIARQYDVPAKWHLETMPIKGGIPKGVARSYYNTSLDKSKEGYELHVGVIVEKKDILSGESPWAVRHAWSVKDGKIQDFTLGSKTAKEYFYLGEHVSPAMFKDAGTLQDYAHSGGSVHASTP